MQVINKKTDELIPYINNPRNNDAAVDAVASSIKNFGFKVPIVIDKNNEIIAGHTRLKAAKKLNILEVPCVVADDLSEAQIKAFRIADNKVAETSEWNIEMLAIELLDLNEFTGFTDAELKDIFKEEDDEIIDDDPPEAPEEPTTRLGDIWILGRHRLMCGDSTNLEDAEILMNGQKADLLLTDPPYNVALGMGGSNDDARKRHRRTDGLVIMNDKMEDSDFRKFLVKVYTTAKGCMKSGAAFYIWHADNEGYNFRGACIDIGWQVRQTLIWKKNSITLGRQDYQWKHEPCLYGWNNGSHSWYSDRKQSTILEFDRPTVSKEHPTMKPVALFDYQIKNSTKSGDIVLDLFMGSGTTIIACEQDGRTGYGMELDPRYADVIVNRYVKLKDSSSDVYLIRDGVNIPYDKAKPEQ